MCPPQVYEMCSASHLFRLTAWPNEASSYVAPVIACRISLLEDYDHAITSFSTLKQTTRQTLIRHFHRQDQISPSTHPYKSGDTLLIRSRRSTKLVIPSGDVGTLITRRRFAFTPPIAREIAIIRTRATVEISLCTWTYH